MHQTFENPTREQIYAVLSRARTIAVVGLSPKPERPSHRVAAALQDHGCRIIPVRPATDSVLGEKAYPDLYSAPGPFDIVDVFLPSARVQQIVDACIELGVPALWLQEGVIDQDAAERARDAGIFVVMNRCLYHDYASFAAEGRPLPNVDGGGTG